MIGMDRLTDEELELEAEYGGGLPRKMARELLAHRRTKAAAWNNAIEAAAERVFEPEASEIRALRRTSQTAPTPSDGTCSECGCAPTNASGLCATCVDERTPTPSDGLREENERLRAHIRTMQGYVQEYLEPIPYVAKHGSGGTFNEPHRHQDEAHAYFMRQQMREAVLNDLIYMLDGPEERAALSASPAQPEGLTK